MRESLIKLIENTFIKKYELPFNNIDKSVITTLKDYCFNVSSDGKVSESIYNSIVDYCLNDIEIDITKLDSNQRYAINNRLRYDPNNKIKTQLKYGFFGETLLNIILNVFFHSKKIISKGYFYNPLEKSEPKGYDSFHFVQNENELEFWFGEAKMYVKYSNAINNIISNLNKALSIEYYENNIRAILTNTKNLDYSICSEIFREINEKLKNESINIYQEIKEKKIKVVYPILIVYEYHGENFDMKITSVLQEIEKQVSDFEILNQIEAELLFIFVPVNNVIAIKTEVLEWILEKKSII